MFRAHLLPGQGFQPFTIWEAKGNVTAKGRPVTSYQQAERQILGILTEASEEEKEQHKQNGHPITHKITQSTAMEKAKTGSYLVLEDGRQFYVQGTKNPGNLNLTMLYYVEERRDIQIGGEASGGPENNR